MGGISCSGWSERQPPMILLLLEHAFEQRLSCLVSALYPGSMSSPSAADEAVITRTRDAMSALRAAEHALLVALGELAVSGAWEQTGHRRIGRFLEELWRVDPGHARHLLQHAEQVLPTVTLTGQALAPRMPHTAAACAAGEIGEEHLRVLVRALARVERIPGLDPSAVAGAEELLAQAARTLSPSGLERVVTALLARLDADGAAPEEEPEPADELLMSRRRDGTLAFTGRVHGGADVELLLETFDALSRPAGPDDPRTLPQRRSEALLDLCAQARAPHGIADDPASTTSPHDSDDTDSHGSDGDLFGDIDWRDPRDEDSASDRRHGHLRPVIDDDTDVPEPRETEPPETEPPETEPPTAGPAAPTSAPTSRRTSPLPIPARAQVAVTIPLEWLRERAGHAQLDSGRPLDPATARRLACDAKAIPVVLGTRSEPIELGRAAYVVTWALRRLLIMRDRGCAHPGCTRRANRCHAHHIWHWADGGPTTLDNLVLLCRYHHHLVHHGGWRIDMREGRPWFVPPRWIDPQRRPIPGGLSLAEPRQDAA